MRPVDGKHPVTLGYRQKMRSNQNYIHRGIDYGCPTGTKVVAATAGRVVHAGRGGMGKAFGIHVVIKTGSVWHSYAHLSKAHITKVISRMNHSRLGGDDPATTEKKEKADGTP